MKTKNIIIFSTLIIAIFVLIFKGITLGNEFSDTYLYILKTDNQTFNESVIKDINSRNGVVKIERLGEQKLYVYSDITTDNKDLLTSFNGVNVTYDNARLHKYFILEYWQFEFRSVAMISISLVILLGFYFVELKGLGFKRWMVINYFIADMILISAIILLLFGYISLINLFGFAFDEGFAILTLTAIMMNLVFRFYELELINRRGHLSFSERNNILLISSVLIFITFLPLFVLWNDLLIKSTIILLSIVLNAIFTLIYKPGLVDYIFKSGEKNRFYKKGMLSKIW